MSMKRLGAIAALYLFGLASAAISAPIADHAVPDNPAQAYADPFPGERMVLPEWSQSNIGIDETILGPQLVEYPEGGLIITGDEVIITADASASCVYGQPKYGLIATNVRVIGNADKLALKPIHVGIGPQLAGKPKGGGSSSIG